MFVPADDLTDPAPATTFAHLDATTVLSRAISELGIYPAVDPLDSTSRIMDPNIVGEEHYNVARGVQKILQVSVSLYIYMYILWRCGWALIRIQHVVVCMECVSKIYRSVPGKCPLLGKRPGACFARWLHPLVLCIIWHMVSVQYTA